MSTSIAARYQHVSGRYLDVLATVPDHLWSAPTPCEEWTVEELARHVVESHASFLGLVDREPPDHSGDDRVAGFDAVRHEVQRGLDDPETAAVEYDGGAGRTFADGVEAFLCFDLTVHAWDLAQAQGREFTIDDEEVERLRRQADDFGDALRGPGWFGPAVDVPADADPQARLLAFLGRTPH